MTASRSPVCSLSFQLKILLPQGTSGNLHHEACTAKTSAALPAAPYTGMLSPACTFSHRHTTQPSPRDGEDTFWGFLGHANMPEGSCANCCLYREKAFKGGGTNPSCHIGSMGERGEEKDNWAEELQGNRFFCYAQPVQIQHFLAGAEV